MGILASQRCRTPLRGNAYMRLLNRFSVKCLMARCCVQDMARNRDRWSRASRSGAVTRRGGDRYGLPWTNAVQVGLGTVEASRRVHGVEATPGSPAMVLVVWTDNVDTACDELAAAQVPLLQPPHHTGNNNRNALLRDPDGNLVEIVAKVS